MPFLDPSEYSASWLFASEQKKIIFCIEFLSTVHFFSFNNSDRFDLTIEFCYQFVFWIKNVFSINQNNGLNGDWYRHWSPFRFQISSQPIRLGESHLIRVFVIIVLKQCLRMTFLLTFISKLFLVINFNLWNSISDVQMHVNTLT